MTRDRWVFVFPRAGRSGKEQGRARSPQTPVAGWWGESDTARRGTAGGAAGGGLINARPRRMPGGDGTGGDERSVEGRGTEGRTGEASVFEVTARPLREAEESNAEQVADRRAGGQAALPSLTGAGQSVAGERKAIAAPLVTGEHPGVVRIKAARKRSRLTDAAEVDAGVID